MMWLGRVDRIGGSEIALSLAADEHRGIPVFFLILAPLCLHVGRVHPRWANSCRTKRHKSITYGRDIPRQWLSGLFGQHNE
jgi:hypothetical protein